MRYELSEQSRRVVGGEYIPATTQQQPVINVHVHNHAAQTGMARNLAVVWLVKSAAVLAVSYFGVMYMQGYHPAEALGFVQDRVSPAVPEIQAAAQGFVVMVRDGIVNLSN